MSTRRGFGVVCALLVVSLLAGCQRGCRSADPAAPPPAADIAVVDLDVGLTAAERAELRFLSEGSDLAPVDLLRALVDPATGRPFSEGLDRYGFLPQPVSDANPYGLPIGWTTDTPELSPNRLPYVGVNCAACHTGRVDFDGHGMVIDGAPNMADIERLGLAIRDAVLTTLEDPAGTRDLISRLAELRHPDEGVAALRHLPADARELIANLRSSVGAGGADDELAAAFQAALRDGSKEEALRRLGDALAAKKREDLGAAFDLLARFGPLVRDRARFGLRALQAIEITPLAGPGRDDPWGLVRNVIFAEAGPLTAPTSIPHLFHVGEFEWYHADGNTTSILQRDVTQALALGAYVDPTTRESTLRPRNLHRLETLWTKVRSPAWPEEILGPIDRELAARGEVLFQRRFGEGAGATPSCADCHRSWAATLVPADKVGTDPNRAESFGRPLGGEPLAGLIPVALEPIIRTAIETAGIPADEAGTFEASDARWRTTGAYVARRLGGVWATAPYLHNGSVPTLADLLLPPAERPAVFHLGHRDYDPVKVGYETTVEVPVFVFDTAVDGNSNAGHTYGTQLGEADRAALVEYLKTL